MSCVQLTTLKCTLGAPLVAALSLISIGCSGSSKCRDTATCASAGGTHGASGASGAGASSFGGNAGSNSGGTAGTTGGAAGQDGGVALAISVTSSSTIRVRPGATTSTLVNIGRTGGFSGGIDITVSGLPPGVGATAVTVPAGASSVDVVITALQTATIGGPTPATIHAVASDNADLNASTDADVFVAGAPGDWDISFGTNGVVTHKLTDREYDGALDVAIDDQGRVVVAGVGQGTPSGVGWLARLMPNGELDASFANQGVAENFGGSNNTTQSVVTVGSSLLVSAAIAGSPVIAYVRKFSESGTVDSTFGTGGDLITGSDPVRELMVRPGGFLGIANYGFVAVTNDGLLDASFSPPSDAQPYRTAIDSQNRVLYARGVSSQSFTIGRLGSTGTSDNTFGTVGTTTLTTPSGTTDNIPLGVIPLSDGGGVLFGQSRFGDIYQNDVVLRRFDTMGLEDSTFGVTGTTTVTAEGIGNTAFAQADDSIVVLFGIRQPGPTISAALGRFLSNGNLDSGFGSGGTLTLGAWWADCMAYDRQAGRAVLVSGGSAGIEVRRVWL